jgi:ArsR family transcriptional regulator
MSEHDPDAATADGRRDDQRDCCSLAERPSPAVVAEDVQTLAALGNDTRYEALRMVANADGDGVCGCDLEPELDVSQGAVSQALSKLFAAGLLDRRKEGRWRYYTATERAHRLLDVLDDTRDSN